VKKKVKKKTTKKDSGFIELNKLLALLKKETAELLRLVKKTNKGKK